MKFEIDEALVKGFLDYLATKPYAEVYQGVQALQNLKPIVEDETK